MMYHCRLCGCATANFWVVKDAKSTEALNMAMCKGCSLVQQVNLPSDEELKIYYSHNYREDYKNTHQPKPKYVHRAGKAAIDRLKEIRKAGVPAQGRLLDIGAGGGEFVYMAQKNGFQATGIEPHEGYSEFARQEYFINIETRQIWEIEDNKLDVVTLFHVLEHLAHPEKVMERVFGLLNESGHFVVEVPNIAQSDASPHNIYFKAHLFYYGAPSLICAASRYFDPVYIRDQGNLFMVFKRKAQALPTLVKPDAQQIDYIHTRLQEKGWTEYLLEGGGLIKLFKRPVKLIEERAIRHLRPRPILDVVFDQSLEETRP